MIRSVFSCSVLRVWNGVLGGRNVQRQMDGNVVRISRTGRFALILRKLKTETRFVLSPRGLQEFHLFSRSFADLGLYGCLGLGGAGEKLEYWTLAWSKEEEGRSYRKRKEDSTENQEL